MKCTVDTGRISKEDWCPHPIDPPPFGVHTLQLPVLVKVDLWAQIFVFWTWILGVVERRIELSWVHHVALGGS